MQEDYIIREIHKISILIMGLLGRMIKNKKEGIELNEDMYSEISDELAEEANVDMDTILKASPDKFDEIFMEKFGFDDKNTELMADMLMVMAEVSVPEQKTVLLRKALEIYSYIEMRTRTYSAERLSKMNEINSHMERL